MHIRNPTALTIGFALTTFCSLSAGRTGGPASLDAATAARSEHQGEKVLWGGLIVNRLISNAQTCLEMVASPLDVTTGRPRGTAGSAGSEQTIGQRFFACGSGDLDAPDFAIGRVATVAGTLGAVQERTTGYGSCVGQPNLGETAYSSTHGACTLRFPVVAVDDSRSWPAPPGQHQPYSFTRHYRWGMSSAGPL